MAGTPTLSCSTVNAFVLGKHHLLPSTRSPDVIQIIRDTAGLHATSGTTPYLSLLARSPGVRPKALGEQLERRTLAKIRCVRGTIYIQPRDWIPAFIAATRRRNIAQTAEYARREGISERRYSAITSEITALLAGTSLTAAAIRKALGFKGDVSAVLYRMCDEALLLRDRPEKGWRDRILGYSLFREAFPDVDLEAIDEPTAMRSIVEQYLRCFGPATEADVVWWTGFSKAEVRKALEALGRRLVPVALGDERRTALLLREELASLETFEHPKGPVVSLLPTLDGYLMGYRDRERYLRPELAGMVFDRSGNVTSTILADGVIVGVWDWEGPESLVKLHFLAPVLGTIRKAAVSAAIEAGLFLFGREAEVGFCESMGPLSQRPAGSVMAPLKGIDAVKRAG